MQINHIELENFLKSLAPQITPIITKYFGQSTISRKGEGINDVITEADPAVQEIIVNAIKEKFPDHGIVAEEQKENYKPESPYQWFIDPIDGTRNFASGVPLFGVMAALVFDGNVEIAMDYLPMTDELYIAKRNMGVTKNNTPVHCSNVRDFKSSYGIGPINAGSKKVLALQQAIAEVDSSGVWMQSVASLAVSGAYVADGRRDWFFSKGSKSWDYMAPALIMKESGCTLLNAEGEDWKTTDLSVVAFNPNLEKPMRKLLEARKKYIV